MMLNIQVKTMVSLIPSYGDRKEIHSVLSHEVCMPRDHLIKSD